MDRDLTIDQIRDRVVDAVNAHDADLVDDIDLPPPFSESLVDLFDRWPRLMMTRAVLGGRPVAAVWLPDRGEHYARVGHVEFVRDPDGAVAASVVDGVDAEVVAQEPPGRSVAEWESATLADSGEGDWV